MANRHFRRRVLFVVLGFAAASAVQSAARGGETVVDRTYGFTFSVPEGYRADPEALQIDPTMIHCFRRDDPESGPIAIFIQALGETLPQGARLAKHAPPPPGADVVASETQWQGLAVEMFTVSATEGADASDIMNSAVLPLSTNGAIQLVVAGPLDQRQTVAETLRNALPQLTGPTNWKTDAQREAELRNRVQKKARAFILMGAVFLIGITGFCLTFRRLSPAKMLGLAFVAWVVAGLNRTDELPSLALSVPLRLLGFIVGIVSLSRLLLGRKAAPKDKLPPLDLGQN